MRATDEARRVLTNCSSEIYWRSNYHEMRFYLTQKVSFDFVVKPCSCSDEKSRKTRQRMSFIMNLLPDFCYLCRCIQKLNAPLSRVITQGFSFSLSPFCAVISCGPRRKNHEYKVVNDKQIRRKSLEALESYLASFIFKSFAVTCRRRLNQIYGSIMISIILNQAM